ncbi:DUF484 family protein [Neogemmobacter tilapiae]|uniref:Tyrosine recombinase XerC n=1 Tax=Neogemmobacter tilapiae TaxID=875041 RepID=A0A918TKY1_9RHOB|nr:DUF484 family protein [Gemmobacter tilapiae]GHC53841.1 tyrosine recombinase XerC [Gemmobacter tilapiae]
MLNADLRDRLLAEPDVILEDRDLMRALIEANGRLMGDNVVDLRGIAMDKLEERLARLEDTHRTVIASAYENLAGTNQLHRAVIQLLDQTDFEGFLAVLNGPFAVQLRVQSVRLILETAQEADEPALRQVDDVVRVAEKGFVESYLTGGRPVVAKPVTLRRTTAKNAEPVFGRAAREIRSEALMALDLGPGRLPGLLALGASDPLQFKPAQGTELLSFLAGVFERLMRRWLA